MKRVILAICLMSSFGTSSAESAAGNAVAVVVQPISIVETQQLNFGSFAVGAVGGTITVTELGVAVPTPDIDSLSGTGVGVGTFDISGEPNTAITVSVSGTATLTDGGANSMIMTPALQAAPPTTTGASGTVTAIVGGDLAVGASQPVGSYATTNIGGSTFTLTVNYN